MKQNKLKYTTEGDIKQILLKSKKNNNALYEIISTSEKSQFVGYMS